MANDNTTNSNQSLVKRMAGRYGVDADKLLIILKATAFKQSGDLPISNEQLAALLVVAEQYNLNPFTKEIYAFPDKKSGGVVPVVGVDGWSRIVNEHKQFNGVDFRYSDEQITPKGASVQCPIWVDCAMYRKDREHPTIVREYLDECYREPFSGTNKSGKGYTVAGPWQSHPKRMLRHKVFMQCARIALGFTGIYDEDYAHNVIDMGSVVQVDQKVDAARVDPVVEALIDRSKKLGNWSAADQYLMQNFSGPEFAYASEKIKAAQAAFLNEQQMTVNGDVAEVNATETEPLDNLESDEAFTDNSDSDEEPDQELINAFNAVDSQVDGLFQ